MIEGKVVEDFGFPSIEVLKFAKLPIVDDLHSLGLCPLRIENKICGYAEFEIKV